MEKEKDYEKRDVEIRHRNNWAFITWGTIVLIAIIYKLLFSEITFDFSSFVFSDFLSLMLSFFAIGISIAFYFKASDASNKFYDNTYKFTKDISENIGRMEERFGEKLSHLDQGYNKFIDSKLWENNSASKDKEIERQEEIKVLESKLEEKGKELEKLIDETKLSLDEKNKLKNQLKQREIELEDLKCKMNNLERNTNEIFVENIMFIKKLENIFINSNYFDVSSFRNLSPSKLNELLMSLIYNTVLYDQLNAQGLIVNDSTLDRKFLNDLRNHIIDTYLGMANYKNVT